MPKRIQSMLWMVSWATCFSLAMTMVKFIEGVPTNTIVFVRFIMSLVVFFPVLMRETKNPFQTKVLPFHAINAVLRLIALFSTYYAYANLPMGLAASIGYTGPIVAIVLAMFILGERVGYQKWIAVTVGYCGVLFMFEPSNLDFTIAVLIALLANVMSSLAKITTKHLTKTDTPGQVMFFGNLIAMLVSGGFILSTSSMPSMDVLWKIMLIGVVGSCSQFSYIKALQATDVSTVAPFEYLRLIMAVPIGYFVFDEYLSRNDIIGATLIIGCSIYLVFREREKSESQAKS